MLFHIPTVVMRLHVNFRNSDDRKWELGKKTTGMWTDPIVAKVISAQPWSVHQSADLRHTCLY